MKILSLLRSNTIFYLILCLLFCITLFFVHLILTEVVRTPGVSRASIYIKPAATTTETLPEPLVVVEPNTISFLGDIMLARSVELLMNEHGADYPFKNVPDIASSSAFIVANFEAAIPSLHEQTPSGGMRFSVSSTAIPYLAKSGITHVSLANNHSLDYGRSAFTQAKNILTSSGIVSFGQADSVSTSSVTYLTVGSTTQAVIAIHTLFSAPDDAILRELLEEMSRQSDVQIAYIHWGEEYSLVHTNAQEKFATRLVALGVDIIIGHHPHVTEDIQIINGVPVFYSLGNFIFDQYFSTAVQEGFVLQLSIAADQFLFTILPITSIGTRSQPRLMNESEREVFLSGLAARSDQTLSDSIKTGKLILSRPLATTPKNSTISR